MKKLLLLALLLGLSGCARASEVSLDEVVEGTATAENYVHATVTDVRTADPLLVELSSGEVTIWATGFAERPGRGTEVWTAVQGPPAENDLVGLVYPTAGELEAPDKGITETGALGVFLGGLGLLGLLIPAVTAALLRLGPGGRCPSCGGRTEEAWITCAHCGNALQKTPPRPKANPTRFTSTPEPAPAESEPEASEAPEAEQPSAGTRIFRRDD